MAISQHLLSYYLIEDNSKIMMTSFAGVPLVIETFRALGLCPAVQKHLPFLQPPRNYQEALFGVVCFGFLCGSGLRR